jgi:hypothetical protein
VQFGTRRHNRVNDETAQAFRRFLCLACVAPARQTFSHARIEEGRVDRTSTQDHRQYEARRQRGAERLAGHDTRATRREIYWAMAKAQPLLPVFSFLEPPRPK